MRYVCEKVFKWVIQKDDIDEDWDLKWTDSAVSPEQLIKMKHFQKINHFPGMYAISRKNYLALNLNKLKKLFHEDFNFFPKTWVAPIDTFDLKLYLSNSQNTYFIVKPEASCQGRGIFITRKVDDIDPNRHVVQEYILNPYLIDNLKFDLRIYVLITGCDPLRVFIFKEGLARFATDEYSKPSGNNLTNNFMHLTNYAVNKLNANFINNTDPIKDNIGHKRSLSYVMKYLESQGIDIDQIQKNIEDSIIKTICCIQPILKHSYNSCQPEDYSNSMCYEVLGFDVILDSDLNHYILEVNHTPSFATDSPLDWEIKQKLITDTLNLVQASHSAQIKYYKKQKVLQYRRKFFGVNEKLTKEQKVEERNNNKAKRDLWESNYLGGFKKIYPGQSSKKYQIYIAAADRLWQEYTGIKHKSKRNLTMKKRNLEEPCVSSSIIELPIIEKPIEYPVFKRLSQPPMKKNRSTVFPNIIYQNIFRRQEKSCDHFPTFADSFLKTTKNSDEMVKKKNKLKSNEKILPNIKKEYVFKKNITLKELLMLEDLKFIQRN